MQLQTILNRVARHKSFVYGEPRWIDDALRPTIEVPIRARANGRPICSGCGRRRPGYDRLQPRRFEFVPRWQIAVVFVYALRRVDCPRCGVIVERVPWSNGKSQLTISYQWFLAGWAKRLSWQEVATVFHTTWEHVRDSVWHAVAWGLVHRDLSGATAIGVDEIQWRRGHHYLTLVYQIDAGCRRLLWIGNLQSVRAYLHREDFQRFWEYRSPVWAGRFLDDWCDRVMRSRLEPLKKVARSLRTHRPLLLNWFRAQGTISSGVIEGFNNKAKLTMRKSYGFREFETIELALYHQLGNLPQPDFTHGFC